MEPTVRRTNLTSLMNELVSQRPNSSSMHHRYSISRFQVSAAWDWWGCQHPAASVRSSLRRPPVPFHLFAGGDTLSPQIHFLPGQFSLSRVKGVRLHQLSCR